jgi:hypothetical protein
MFVINMKKGEDNINISEPALHYCYSRKLNIIIVIEVVVIKKTCVAFRNSLG